ncbi:ATPase family gene 2 protein homolog B-like isoform X2 [Tachypleus tridentatus]|uniref:ATPase family gene 2 protein homolog B-like isoform X2 n=1 Tax=Tachypleus tridentatus TaxID=6853 RepID=UPI003FD26F5D
MKGYDVFVKVVVTSIHQVIKWRKAMSRLSRWVASIIRGNNLKDGNIIECIHHPLGQLCKIFCIVIEETIPNQTSRKFQVKVKSIISRERYEQDINSKGQRLILLGGLNSPELYLKHLVSFPLLYPRSLCKLGLESFKGVLLTGPPGGGKTSLVKKVAIDCKALLVTVRGPELCHSEPGESEMELRKVFEDIQLESEEGPTILFIDEIDSICPKRHSGISSHSRRLLAQLLILMDGLDVRNKFVIIGATNRPDLLDSAIRRPGRFDKEVFIGIPTFEQREEIFRVLTLGLNLASNVDLTELALHTPGYVGGDIELLCQEATFTCLRNHRNIDFNGEQADIQVSREDFMEVLKQMCPSSQRSSSWQCDVKPVKWSDIGGLEQVKRRMQIAVEWPLLYPEAFARMGISKPRGVLLFGPPGCCKTNLVQAAATNCHVTFLAVSGAQIFSPLVGDSERSISQVFHHARLGAPSIVFIDELDSVVGKRAAAKHQSVQERVLSTLLNELDGVGIRIEDKRGTLEYEGTPTLEIQFPVKGNIASC